MEVRWRIDRSTGRAVAACLLSMTVAVSTGGCDSGSDRSVEAFCTTITSEKARILEQFEATSSAGQGDEGLEVLVGLVVSIQGLGELRTYTRKWTQATQRFRRGGMAKASWPWTRGVPRIRTPGPTRG